MNNNELEQAKAKLATLEKLEALSQRAIEARETYVKKPGRFGDMPTELIEFRIAELKASRPTGVGGGDSFAEWHEALEEFETEIERRKELTALQDRVANLEAGILASNIVKNTQALADIVSDWAATNGPQIKVEDTPGAKRAAETEAKLSADFTAIIDGLAKMCITMIDALDKTAAKDGEQS